MNKFHGKVGYIKTVQDPDDDTVWEPITPIERTYYGDIRKNVSRWKTGDNVNDNIVVSNTISIVADAFAFENYLHIRYVEWMGHKLEVTSVEIQYPRLILSVGGVYNG